MHEARLIGKSPKKKYHSYKGKVGKIADNIINRDLSTTALYRNGQQMCLSSIFHGESVIYRQCLI